jgi:hypothetical protein
MRGIIRDRYVPGLLGTDDRLTPRTPCGRQNPGRFALGATPLATGSHVDQAFRLCFMGQRKSHGSRRSLLKAAPNGLFTAQQ